MSGEKVSLNFVKKPDYMYQRGSNEINSLKKYSYEISEKRLNNQIVTNEEIKLLETMNKTYRTTSDSICNKIYEMIINSTNAVSIHYGDYETKKSFMKIYFSYDTAKTDIESGYIPYINIYDDHTIIVPIRTINANTSEYDKVYARLTISETLYDEIKLYYDNKSYEQIK
jgi:hypothetical protein